MGTGKRRKRRNDLQTLATEQAAAYGVNVPVVAASERYLSPNDIGKILNITGEAVKQWIYHRRLPAVKLANGYWKIKVADFEAFLKARQDVGKRRVLVADSKEGFATDVIQAVEKLGHQAIVAHNYADALLKSLDQHPSLIVINCGAASAEPWKLAAKIRSTRGLRGVPILLVAGADLSEADAERAVELQAQGFLKRPVEPDALAGEVQRILQRSL